MSDLLHRAGKWSLFIWFFIAWAAIILIFIPAYRAGFEGDFWGGLYLFQEHNFFDYINSVGNKIKSLYQLTKIELWIFTTLFGHQPVPWFLLQTGLHALNVIQLYALLLLWMNVLPHLQNKTAGQKKTLALWCAILFAVAQVHVDTVIWKGSFHYLNGLAMMLFILNRVTRFALTAQTKYALQAVGVFALSCFSLEIFYLTPIYSFCILLFLYRLPGVITQPHFHKTIMRVVVPMLILFAGYYILYVSLYHKGLAHYDLSSDDQFLPKHFLPKWAMYPAQILFFLGNLPVGTRMWWVDHVFYQPIFYYGVLLAVFFLTVFFIRRSTNKANMIPLLGLLFVLSMGALIIVSPLWYFHDFSGRNGHYCYVLSAFLIPLFVLWIEHVFRYKKLVWVGFCLYGAVQLFFTVQQVIDYRKAGHVFEGVRENFIDRKTTDTKLLLNLPALYKGIVVIASDTIDNYNLLHKVFSPDTIKGTVFSVSSFNMNGPGDGAHVTVLDSATIKVTLNQWGTWWWFKSFGAFSYENEWFRFDLTDPGHEYILHLKQPAEPMSLYYFTGWQWKKVNRSIIGKEQW